ncbi:hypothetical protein ACFX13_022660 [Malus domestica]
MGQIRLLNNMEDDQVFAFSKTIQAVRPGCSIQANGSAAYGAIRHRWHRDSGRRSADDAVWVVMEYLSGWMYSIVRIHTSGWWALFRRLGTTMIRMCWWR